jgi:hypothetical protein
MCVGNSYVYCGQLCLSSRFSLYSSLVRVMSGRVEGIVLSVIMLRFQYSFFVVVIIIITIILFLLLLPEALGTFPCKLKTFRNRVKNQL